MTDLRLEALDRHAQAQVDQLALLRAELPSGYRQSVWCINQACHAPIPAGTATCPECGTATKPPESVPPRPVLLSCPERFELVSGLGQRTDFGVRGPEELAERLYAHFKRHPLSPPLTRTQATAFARAAWFGASVYFASHTLRPDQREGM